MVCPMLNRNISEGGPNAIVFVLAIHLLNMLENGSDSADLKRKHKTISRVCWGMIATECDEIKKGSKMTPTTVRDKLLSYNICHLWRD